MNTEYEETEIIADTYIEQIESDIKLRERIIIKTQLCIAFGTKV